MKICFSLFVATAMMQQAIADPVEFIFVQPDSGLIESNGSSMSVTETTDGHVVEYSFANRNGGRHAPMTFLSTWNSPLWTEFSVDQRSEQIGGTSIAIVDWAPWDGTPLNARLGFTYRLQPNLDHTISTQNLSFCETCEPNSFVFEYSVRTVEPPLLGDFNEDDAVDMDDFLTLSESYGRYGFWHDGDADLNGAVEFSDYLLLSANFGQTRETEVASAVPEPSSALLLLLALPYLRRRCR